MSRLLTTFYPTQPYNFPLLLDFIRRHPAPTLDIATGKAYRRVFAQGDHLALVQAVNAGSGIEISLLAQSGTLNEADLIGQVAQVLAIHAPQRTKLWNMMQADERLRDVFAPLVGLPMLRAASLFEALINVIIEQQIAWRAAVKAQRWLLEWGGRYLDYDGQRYYAYPTPDQLASATQADLKPLKITFKRIDLIRHLANPSPNPLPELREGTTPTDTYQALLKIKGIGHWTAAVVTQRIHGTSPFVAHNDVALQMAAGRYFYDRAGKVSQQEVSATFAPYGEYGGDVAFYTLVRWVFAEYAAL